MNFLQRFLSDDKTTNETLLDSFCESDCIKELKKLGSCSYSCLYDCPSTCNMVIDTPDISPPPVMIHQDDSLKRFVIIAASSIITTLILLTLLVICFKFYNRRRSLTISRRWSMEEAMNYDFDGTTPPVIIDHPIWHIRTIGLNPSVISSIKVCKYSKKDGVVEGTDCSVCLSEFEEEETLRLLPKCKHAFHLSCIDTWLRSHTNCPLCRAPITASDDDHSEGLEEIRVIAPEENGETVEEIEREHEEERDGFVVSTISGDHGEAEESRQQRVRRTMSLDLRVVVGKEKEKRGGSSIVGRTSFLKRSISYSGK